MNIEQMRMNGLVDTEEDVYAKILPELLNVIESNWVAPEALSFDKRKYFSAITYKGSVVARLNFGSTKATTYIEFPEKSIQEFNFAHYDNKTKNGMTKIFILSPNDIVDEFHSIIARSLDIAISQFPKDFDCCSRYEICSDKRHCIHPDRNFSSGCGYRKMLKTGKIFYGKNRNV